MTFDYERKGYEKDIERSIQSIEDRVSFLIDFMGVQKEIVEKALEVAERAFHLGDNPENYRDYSFIDKNRVKMVVESPKNGLGLRQSHMLYNEFYGLVFDHYQIRYALNKINKPTTYEE